MQIICMNDKLFITKIGMFILLFRKRVSFTNLMNRSSPILTRFYNTFLVVLYVLFYRFMQYSRRIFYQDMWHVAWQSPKLDVTNHRQNHVYNLLIWVCLLPFYPQEPRDINIKTIVLEQTMAIKQVCVKITNIQYI